MKIQAETATKLTTEQKKLLVSKLQSIFSEEIELVEIVDPKLMGGLRLIAPSHTLDLSISAKFNSLKLNLFSA